MFRNPPCRTMNAAMSSAIRLLPRNVASVGIERMTLRSAKALLVAAFVAVASVLAYPHPVQAFGIGSHYVEVGDAGDSLSDAQFLTGGPYDGIFGRIDDSVDVFAFHWIGGDFVAAFVSGSDPAIALYDFSENLLGSAIGLAPVLTIPAVAAGNYLFEISLLSGPDLGYSVGIGSPTHPDIRLTISAPRLIAEPAPLALVILALATLGISRPRLRA